MLLEPTTAVGWNENVNHAQAGFQDRKLPSLGLLGVAGLPSVWLSISTASKGLID
jgi:hypothetical protein